MAPLQLEVLGYPQVRRDAQVVGFKTRKTLALLLYLALEPGWHSRDKLAELLWPDTDQEGARGSLRKSLTMMRQALGEDFPLHVERERLCLGRGCLQTDLEHLQVSPAPPFALGGLLRDFSLPEAPAFDEWLDTQRKTLQTRLDGLLYEQMVRHQSTGQSGAALELAQARIHLDPLNERAYLEHMRLLWGRGEGSQALEVFRQCRARLRGELGAEPSAEMLRLVQLIQGHSGTLVRPTLKSERSANQVGLVGRESEWAQMEEAWGRGQAILLGGEAGVGKTRLALEFAASKGAIIRLWGRQGDEGIPYATHARNFGYVMNDQPELEAKLPGWVRLEMSRIVPWLGPLPAPIRSEAEKMRFIKAKIETYRLAAEDGWWDTLFFDDTQFVDAQTAEAGMYLHRQLLPYPPGFPRAIFAFRTGELPDFQNREYQSWVREGLAVWIELSPLPTEAVQSWLFQRGLSGLTDEVMHLTGGNPLLIHETLQAVGEHLEGAPLPRSQRAKQMLAERLGRLSPAALGIAQVAALASSDFSFNMGEWVLGLDQGQTERAAEELQKAGIFRGKAFSHDLLFESALEGIAPERRAELSGRIADYLEQTQPYIAPARLARYYLSSRERERAAQCLLGAGQLALDSFAQDEAADWFERAAGVLGELDRTVEAQEAAQKAHRLREAQPSRR